MFNIKKNEINEHIKKLTKEDIFSFASKYNLYLSKEELEFVYSFVKNNNQNIINNPKSFNLNNYKNKFSENNFQKLSNLYKKYSDYLNLLNITD